MVTDIIKKGYKQTELGLIPEDWVIKSIEDLTPQGRKYNIVDGPFGSNLKTIHYRKSGIPIITSGYVTDGKFFAPEYLYVDLDKFIQERRSAVRGGDIVMAKIGERCGASAILPKDHRESILSGNALKITIDESKFSTELISQILWRHHMAGYFDVLRTTGAQPAISMANLKKYKISIPSTKSEQITIFTTLSDTDALIGNLEKLIDKKKAIKEGTMQQLLTGKKRLPGFSEKWEEAKLKEFAFFLKGRGLSKDKIIYEGNYPCILYGELFTTYSRVIKEIKSKTNHKEGLMSVKGDILLPGSTTTIGIDLTIASALQQDNILLGGDLIVIRQKKLYTYNSEFLANYLTHISKYEIAEITQGITIIHLHGSRLQEILVIIPSDIKEQDAIATILSDIDSEIQELEKKRDKYIMIKQGMMQNLLTGKIRIYGNK